MNYFILPKISNKIKFKISYIEKIDDISSSYLYQYSKIKDQINENLCKPFDNETSDFSRSFDCTKSENFSEFDFIKSVNTQRYNNLEIYKLINPYVYLQIPMDDFNYISKIIQNNDMFFNLIEVINNFNLFDKTVKINIFNDEIEENIIIDIMNFYKDIKFVLNDKNFKYDFLIYDINDTKYTSNNFVYFLLQILYIIINSQNLGGFSVFRINNIFSNIIIEFLFVLSNFYDDKIIIFKPLSGNNMTNERFVICKNFNLQNILQYQILNGELTELLKHFINSLINKEYLFKNKINSFLNMDIPLFFLNKIEECNIIIGHSQLDYLYQIINNIKLNCENVDKLENIKKSNIKKCIDWCEKYQVPHNKIEISEKSVNIFT